MGTMLPVPVERQMVELSSTPELLELRQASKHILGHATTTLRNSYIDRLSRLGRDTQADDDNDDDDDDHQYFGDRHGRARKYCVRALILLTPKGDQSTIGALLQSTQGNESAWPALFTLLSCLVDASNANVRSCLMERFQMFGPIEWFDVPVVRCGFNALVHSCRSFDMPLVSFVLKNWGHLNYFRNMSLADILKMMLERWCNGFEVDGVSTLFEMAVNEHGWTSPIPVNVLEALARTHRLRVVEILYHASDQQLTQLMADSRAWLALLAELGLKGDERIVLYLLDQLAKALNEGDMHKAVHTIIPSLISVSCHSDPRVLKCFLTVLGNYRLCKEEQELLAKALNNISKESDAVVSRALADFCRGQKHDVSKGFVEQLLARSLADDHVVSTLLQWVWLQLRSSISEDLVIMKVFDKLLEERAGFVADWVFSQADEHCQGMASLDSLHKLCQLGNLSRCIVPLRSFCKGPILESQCRALESANLRMASHVPFMCALLADQGDETIIHGLIQCLHHLSPQMQFLSTSSTHAEALCISCLLGLREVCKQSDERVLGLVASLPGSVFPSIRAVACDVLVTLFPHVEERRVKNVILQALRSCRHCVLTDTSYCRIVVAAGKCASWQDSDIIDGIIHVLTSLLRIRAALLFAAQEQTYNAALQSLESLMNMRDFQALLIVELTAIVSNVQCWRCHKLWLILLNFLCGPCPEVRDVAIASMDVDLKMSLATLEKVARKGDPIVVKVLMQHALPLAERLSNMVPVYTYRWNLLMLLEALQKFIVPDDKDVLSMVLTVLQANVRWEFGRTNEIEEVSLASVKLLGVLQPVWDKSVLDVVLEVAKLGQPNLMLSGAILSMLRTSPFGYHRSAAAVAQRIWDVEFYIHTKEVKFAEEDILEEIEDESKGTYNINCMDAANNVDHSKNEYEHGRAEVLEEVIHAEPAADIPPEEAEAVAEQQWAQLVSRLAMTEPTTNASGNSSAVSTADLATTNPQECLLPNTYVMTRSGLIFVADLEEECELVPGRAGHESVVRNIVRHELQERRLVTLHFQGGSLTMTTAHPLMVLQDARNRNRRFYPVLAAEVQKGDLLQTYGSQVIVTDVEHHISDTEVVEIQLKDVQGSFFVRDASISSCDFLEVCGALAPLHNQVVSILHFQRHDRFKLLRENPMLTSCSDELEREGWSTDLGELGEASIGPGKLFVRPGLAWRVVRALQSRGRSKSPLCLSDVVVSEEFKLLVEEAVHQHAPRANPVKSIEILELGPAVEIRNTFLEAQTGLSSSSVSAHSSTDAHIGKGKNPRKRKVVDI